MSNDDAVGGSLDSRVVDNGLKKECSECREEEASSGLGNKTMLI